MVHRRLALIGRGISYSLSGPIHRLAAEACGVENVTYDLLDLHQESLPDVREILHRKAITGINITQPYKQCIGQYLLSEHEGGGVSFGPHSAYNVGVCDPAPHWQLGNTDGAGFFDALRYAQIPTMEVKTLVILGLGGAMVGVLESLCDHRSPYAALFSWPLDVHIFARRFAKTSLLVWPGDGASTTERAGEAAASLPELAGCVRLLRDRVWGHPWRCESWQRCLQQHEKILWVQATSLPHQGEDMEDFAAALLQVPHDAVVGGLDMTYAPSSAIYRQARRLDMPCVAGWDMLVAQARACEDMWWGTSPSFVLLKSLLQQHLHRAGMV